MLTGSLYHMVNVAGHECTHTEYKHGGLILQIQKKGQDLLPEM